LRRQRRHSAWWIAVFAVAAVAAYTSGQALGASPDDRPVYRGSSKASAPTSVSPDDRTFNRGSSAASAPTSVSPDDRPFARSQGEIAFKSATVRAVAEPGGFDWGDAVIGGAFGLALALGTGAILIAHRRRSTLRTA
jgi:hypothetical protein